MALVVADRVRETTTTTGTGTVNLGGAATGYQTFVAGAGDGAEVYYVIVGQSGGAAANEWEVGVGTVTDASPDTLSRDTVLSSSNSDALVNFSSGTKDVILTEPAGLKETRRSVDDPWHGDDDVEFERDTVTSLPSGWSWTNQGGASYREGYGYGQIIAPNLAGDNYRIIKRSAPAGWTEFWAKIHVMGYVAFGGICLRDSSNGRLIVHYINMSNNNISTMYFNSPTSYNSTINNWPQHRWGEVILGVIKNSSTDYDFTFTQHGGPDGGYWDSATAVNPTSFLTIDELGFACQPYNGTYGMRMDIKWARFL